MKKYKSEEERKAAEKEYQAKYRALRKSGKWVRKTKVRSPRIAAKLGIITEGQRLMAERKALLRKRILAKWGTMTAYNEHIEALRKRRMEIAKMSPEEREAAKREYERQKNAEYRERHRAHISAYNRAYNRRRRDAQATPEQLKKREERRAVIYGNTTAGIIEKLTRDFAAERKVTPDEMTAQMVATGAVDFLIRALESQMRKIKNKTLIRRIAAEALRFYLDRETAHL